MSNIDWEDIEALETMANQCIYKGKEVGQARAALKAIYGYDVVYEDEVDDYSSYSKVYITKENK